MNEILLANLFFIITGSAVLIVAAFLCVVCYYLIKVIKRGRGILERVETSAQSLLCDVQALREHIGDYIAQGTVFGRMLVAIAHTVSALSTKTQKRSASRRKKGIADEELSDNQIYDDKETNEKH